MYAWLGICMALACAFGFVCGRMDFKPPVNWRLMFGAWAFLIAALWLASRYELRADGGVTAVMDSWSGRRVATIYDKHSLPSE